MAPVKQLLDRLWTTRRRSDNHHAAVIARLEALLSATEDQARNSEMLAALGADLAETRGALERVAKHLGDGQAELRTRLRRTQALTARVYETLADWPGLLAAAREHSSYELAYSDPEPVISIPISTYHSPQTLCDRALASVREQTYSRWEAIVVGDHCTDDTERRVRAIGEERIRFHNLPVREVDPDDPWERWAVKGSVPRAVGIERSSGRWIAPLSHDDAWDPDHLERLLGAAREHHAEVVYSRMRELDAEADGNPRLGTVGAWPPQAGQFAWQSAMFHGALSFLRYDRRCALASEPNDVNLMRRAWEAGVRFHFLDRETSTLFRYRSARALEPQYEELGLPPSSAAAP